MKRTIGKKNMISYPAAGALVLFFFFLSGALGLIYEVIWTRLLRLVMGNTVFSITTVLCAFMGGLALGSFFGGRIIERRKDPLRIFAFLQGIIGIYCLLLPEIIRSVEPLYRIIYQNYHASFYLFSLIRFFFSGILLLLPTTLMGATLPVLTRYFVRSSHRIGWRIGTLYAVNTFGAVLGAFSAGFLLLPFFGVSKTIYLAAAFNLLLFVFVYRLHWQSLPVQPEFSDTVREKKEQQISGVSRPFLRVLLIGYALSGFAALTYEIAWTRVLILVVGSSVYAFSLILTVFILGLALGSICFSRFIDRRKDLILFLALIELAIGFSALLVVPLFGHLPLFIVGIILRFSHSFWLLQLAEFLLMFILLLIPTTMMGIAFPVASRIYIRTPSSAASSVGTVYAANTFGSILGAFAGGFILIPWLGIQGAILSAVLINVAVGCVFLLVSRNIPGARKGLIVATAIIAAALSFSLFPGWNEAVMSSGTYLNAREISRLATGTSSTLEQQIRRRGKVIYHKEGVSTTVTVKETPEGGKHFFVNGKPDASSSEDMSTQELLAHLPLLLHPDPKEMLVIGLATGVTLGSAGLYPVERLDCVEISPAVVEASHYFDDINYNILSDPRVDLIIADGRNHLSLTDRSYDVITSEPSNFWMAGVADLFTREFFQLCRRRLNPGGVACVWLYAYDIENEIFRTIVHTFQTIFPHTTIWESALAADYLLIGSAEEIRVDYAGLCRRLEDERIRRDLARIEINTAAELLAHLVMDKRAVKSYAQGAGLHTDDNAVVEFSAPRTLYRTGIEIPLLEALNRYRASGLSFVTWEGEKEPKAEEVKLEIAQLIKARRCVLRGHIYLARNMVDEALAEFKKAVSLNFRDPVMTKADIVVFLARAVNYLQQGLIDRAIEAYRDVLELDPDCAEAHHDLAVACLQKGLYEEAIAEFEAALRITPDDADTYYNLGFVHKILGNHRQTKRCWEKAIQINPRLPQVRRMKEYLKNRERRGH